MRSRDTSSRTVGTIFCIAKSRCCRASTLIRRAYLRTIVHGTQRREKASRRRPANNAYTPSALIYREFSLGGRDSRNDPLTHSLTLSLSLVTGASRLSTQRADSSYCFNRDIDQRLAMIHSIFLSCLSARVARTSETKVQHQPRFCLFATTVYVRRSRAIRDAFTLPSYAHDRP